VRRRLAAGLRCYRDRGSLTAPPLNITGHAGPYTAVRWIDRLAEYEGWQAERRRRRWGRRSPERAVGEPPRIIAASGGLRGKVPPTPRLVSSANRVRPLFHCFQAMARSRRLVHWSRARNASLAEADPLVQGDHRDVGDGNTAAFIDFEKTTIWSNIGAMCFDIISTRRLAGLPRRLPAQCTGVARKIGRIRISI
jgi:hypothetical protein